MEGSSVRRQIAWPVLAAVLAAGVTSALWFYQQQALEAEHAAVLESFNNATETQAEKNNRLARINGELTENLADVQALRLRLESDINELRQQLADAEAELVALHDKNWESRYAEVVAINEALTEKLSELEFQHRLALEEQQLAYNELSNRHDKLADDFMNLEMDHEDLGGSYGRLKEIYITESIHQELLQQSMGEDLMAEEFISNERADLVSDLRKDITAKKNAIAELESAIKDGDRRIAELQSGIADRETRIATLQQQLTQPKQVPVAANTDEEDPIQIVAVEESGKISPAGDYRNVRLSSLRTAMNGRASAERKLILQSVIPTIPNGISGSELITLVSGMQSADILSVVKKTRQHIARPLDDESLLAIADNMNKEDAAMVSALLTQ